MPRFQTCLSVVVPWLLSNSSWAAERASCSRQWWALLGSVSYSIQQNFSFIHTWVRTAFSEEMLAVFPLGEFNIFLWPASVSPPLSFSERTNNPMSSAKGHVTHCFHSLSSPNTTDKTLKCKDVKYWDLNEACLCLNQGCFWNCLFLGCQEI